MSNSRFGNNWGFLASETCGMPTSQLQAARIPGNQYSGPPWRRDFTIPSLQEWSVIAIPTNICYHDDAVEVGMPEYVIEREIPGAGNLSDAEIQEIARKSVAVLNDMGPKIKWLHSYVTGDKIYCVYFAPDEETIREHGRRGGFPVNRVAAVRRMIDPSTAG